MNVMRVSYVRREVRNYADAPVAQRVLEALIAAAIEAPGACCEQPWHFTVIRNQPLLDRISGAAKTRCPRLASRRSSNGSTRI